MNYEFGGDDETTNSFGNRDFTMSGLPDNGREGDDLTFGRQYGGNMGEQPDPLASGDIPFIPQPGSRHESTAEAGFAASPDDVANQALQAARAQCTEFRTDAVQLDRVDKRIIEAEATLKNLRREAQDLAGRVEAQGDQVSALLNQGRLAYFSALPKTSEGYVTGKEYVANAVRLSPDLDLRVDLESDEQRVNAVLELGDKIRVGEKVIIYDRFDDDEATFVGGVARHDNFSLTLENADTEENKFMLGLNNQGTVPASYEASVYTDDNATVQVHVGEDAAVFVKDQCNTYLAMLDGVDAEVQDATEVSLNEKADMGLYATRRSVSATLTEAVNAARNIDVQPVADEGRMRLTDRLLAHMFDIVDSDLGYTQERLQTVGHALSYAYPHDSAERDFVEYVVDASRARITYMRGGHNQVAVADVLAAFSNFSFEAVYERLHRWE